MAPHDPSLSLSDPGNLHPKRHASTREHGPSNHRSRNHRDPSGRGGDPAKGSNSSSQNRHHKFHSGSITVRRKSDSNATNSTNTSGRGMMFLSSASSSGNTSVWGPSLPASLRNQHLAHKCSYTDGASVSAGSSSRSSTDLLASPGPPRAGAHG